MPDTQLTNPPQSVIPAAAAAATSSVDPFPQTAFLTATNSLGVVTGQPAADTVTPTQPAADTAIPTQPAADTDVGTAVTIPAVGTGIQTIPIPYNNGTATLTVSANNSTTVILGGIPTGSASGSAASNSAATTSGMRTSGSGSASGSPTGSAAGGDSTAGATNLKVAAGSMVGFGAFVAAFL